MSDRNDRKILIFESSDFAQLRFRWHFWELIIWIRGVLEKTQKNIGYWMYQIT